MATKKTTNTDNVTSVADMFEAKEAPVQNNASVDAVVPYVESKLWITVEDATDVKTFAMNMPTGVMIMTVTGGKSAMYYVSGTRYDVTAKRFSV